MTSQGKYRLSGDEFIESADIVTRIAPKSAKLSGLSRGCVKTSENCSNYDLGPATKFSTLMKSTT
jgi:hypothetical protein